MIYKAPKSKELNLRRWDSGSLRGDRECRLEIKCLSKFPYSPLRIKKALGIFRKVVTTTRTTTVVALWDPSRVQKLGIGRVLGTALLTQISSASESLKWQLIGMS